jgi:glycosyltransferase involved in cell wall biosynthesis
LAHAADAEPFGRVVVEAQAAGVPVVAYASGGVPEIVTPGETGVLVPAHSPAALGAGIDALLRDPDERERLGRAAAAAAARRFDPARHAARMMDLFDELDPPGTVA